MERVDTIVIYRPPVETLKLAVTEAVGETMGLTDTDTVPGIA